MDTGKNNEWKPWKQIDIKNTGNSNSEMIEIRKKCINLRAKNYQTWL